MTTYGYARVSTTKQGTHGTSLEDQCDQLTVAGATVIISDQYTGTKMDRPNFSKLMKQLQPGDKLIVTKLDRLARTAIDGGAIVRELHDRGVVVHILNMGVADASPMGRMMVTVLLAFAEFERDMIIERTAAGKAAARAKGVRVDGRPLKFQRAQRDHAMHLLDEYSYSQVATMTGISKATLARYRRAAKLATV